MSDLIAALDELERRRRREAESLRSWVLRTTTGHDGPIPPPPSWDGHHGNVTLLLDLEDVADALRVSPSTVKRLIRAGLLPAVKVQRNTRVRHVDLLAYVDHLGDDLEAEDRTTPTPTTP